MIFFFSITHSVRDWSPSVRSCDHGGPVDHQQQVTLKTHDGDLWKFWEFLLFFKKKWGQFINFTSPLGFNRKLKKKKSKDRYTKVRVFELWNFYFIFTKDVIFKKISNFFSSYNWGDAHTEVTEQVGTIFIITLLLLFYFSTLSFFFLFIIEFSWTLQSCSSKIWHFQGPHGNLGVILTKRASTHSSHFHLGL